MSKHRVTFKEGGEITISQIDETIIFCFEDSSGWTIADTFSIEDIKAIHGIFSDFIKDNEG